MPPLLTHWLPGGKNINLNSLLWTLNKHWNMLELDGKVASVWARGLVVVVFNIVLNTLWFILMAVLRQHVKEGEPICVTSTRANHRTLGHICSVSGTHCLLEHCGNTAVVKWGTEEAESSVSSFYSRFLSSPLSLSPCYFKSHNIEDKSKTDGTRVFQLSIGGVRFFSCDGPAGC